MSHPYSEIEDWHFWSKSVTDQFPHSFDPVTRNTFTIAPDDRVATMGSCFAQHIARHLQSSGLNYFVTEPGPRDLDDRRRRELNYGTFSARYGNVYTVRQALQLLQRAFGEFKPTEDVWTTQNHVLDPFRPRIQEGGFSTVEELELDRQQHLEAVQRLVTEADFLVFTLGLTEAWVSRRDGAVFPLVPGSAGGRFDDAIHKFVNFNASQVLADLTRFVDRLKELNTRIQVVLTVSPVPLMATYTDDYVVNATSYSKSVLRVAAGEVSSQREFVHYFPSYEIITGIPSGNRYFESDLRSVSERGVFHVMRSFFAHHVAGLEVADAPVSEAQLTAEVLAASNVVCDEEALDPVAARGRNA